jgi:hypothetical protein
MSSKIPERVLPDRPVYRPLERFWPYADLPEQPSDEELAALHPELRAAIFGADEIPFSISIVFPKFDGPNYEPAVALAKASDEYLEATADGVLRHRARFYPAKKPAQLRDLNDLVCDVDGMEVLLDDQPVPYARSLWLPLVWFLIK